MVEEKKPSPLQETKERRSVVRSFLRTHSAESPHRTLGSDDRSKSKDTMSVFQILGTDDRSK